jgi:hypothetical protein
LHGTAIRPFMVERHFDAFTVLHLDALTTSRNSCGQTIYVFDQN